MTRPTRRQPLGLPLRWYWSLPRLADEWGCAVDDLLYCVDAGLLRACVLVSKAKLPPIAQGRLAPFVCIVLASPNALDWQHADAEGCALLTGEFAAFAVQGERYGMLAIELLEPVLIARRDLVVLDADRETFEAARSVPQPRRSNKAQDRADALVMRALIVKAYGEPALANHYTTARRIREAIELEGAELNDKTIALKIKAAAEVLPLHAVPATVYAHEVTQQAAEEALPSQAPKLANVR
jgi:hypothetical protein